jgi:hypothetical protein
MKKQILAIIILIFILLIIWIIPGYANEPKIIITQDDENQIKNLVADYNRAVEKIYHPYSSLSQDREIEQTEEYKKLLVYDAKLIPYLIRQRQIESESRVIVGSALAARKIKSVEDLYTYQSERGAKLRQGIQPWINYPGGFILGKTTIGTTFYKSLGPYPFDKRFSWLEWWEQNKNRFEFKTNNPIVINTEYKYYNHPHISTEIVNGLLNIEAVNAPYHQIIERAAAEMGVDIFIGEQEYIDVLTAVRMRGVTFEEFAYLVGKHVSVNPFKYQKIGDKYYFGSNIPAKPRRIINGWGIKMDKTVFSEGDPIPVTIITRYLSKFVSPEDPAFSDYGSFKITTNDDKVIKDYNKVFWKPHQPGKFIELPKDCAEVDIVLNKDIQLKPGEYNIRFKYLTHETPSIAIEIYNKKK